jgi:hypothetical protein
MKIDKSKLMVLMEVEVKTSTGTKYYKLAKTEARYEILTSYSGWRWRTRLSKPKHTYVMLWGNVDDVNMMGTSLLTAEGSKVGQSKATKIFMKAIEDTKHMTFTRCSKPMSYSL